MMVTDNDLDNLIKDINDKILGSTIYLVKRYESTHTERVSRGYDHLGHLGYDDVRVVDRVYYQIEQKVINTYNLVGVMHKRSGGLASFSPAIAAQICERLNNEDQKKE